MEEQNKKLLEKIEVLEFELKETAKSFNTLIEILIEITTTEDVESMFQGVLSILNNYFHFEQSLFIASEQNEFKVMASAGFDKNTKFKSSKHLDNSLAWCVYNLKSFMNIKNMDTDPRFNKDEFFQQTKPMSAIATYLEQDKINGIFIFYLDLESTASLRHISTNLDMLLTVLAPHLGKFVSHLQAIKEKRIIQEQLIQSGKLASLGMMSAGIAHELNNPLFAIMALAQNIQMKPQGEKTPQYAEQIVQCTERMSKVIQHLKVFSRKSEELDFREIDITIPITESLKLFAPQLRQESIETILKFANSPPLRCLGDSVQLESVFQNLIANSKDAFENILDNRKKFINVEVKIDEDRIKIIYIDNAGGMPPQVMEKIYDPFFTTKGIGKGTGLGMNLAYEIIKQHSGKIVVSSNLGEGTTFEIYFPYNANPH
ncbi:MAG: GHKL domain-containing protein [Oligoflexia bacterium]|nr:GHKL domain-containing protein [Oligoflexia bacterium]